MRMTIAWRVARWVDSADTNEYIAREPMNPGLSALDARAAGRDGLSGMSATPRRGTDAGTGAPRQPFSPAQRGTAAHRGRGEIRARSAPPRQTHRVRAERRAVSRSAPDDRGSAALEGARSEAAGQD